MNILNISAAIVSINMVSEMDLHPYAVSITELKPRANDRNISPQHISLLG